MSRRIVRMLPLARGDLLELEGEVVALDGSQVIVLVC